MSISLQAPLPGRKDKAWLLALVLSLPLAFLPFSRLFMLPLALLALLGIAIFVRQLATSKTILHEDKALHVFMRCVFFLWVPMLLSAADAVAPGMTWKATGLYALYVMAGLALLALLRLLPVYRLVYGLLTLVIMFWALDGVVQTLIGFDLFGVPLDRPEAVHGHASSFFSRPNVYGFYMGMLATLPLYTLYLLDAPRRLQGLVLLLLTAGVLVGAARGGWVMYAWALLPYLYLVFVKPARHPWRVALITVAAAVLMFLAVLQVSPGMQERLSRSEGFGQWDYQSVNRASSMRLDIWVAAIDMGVQHPLNGVGVNSFEKTFRPYLPPQATWPDDVDASHPHHAVLEIWSGAGVPGLLGFVLVWLALWRLWRQASPEQRTLALPVLIPLAVLWWPVNTHRGFYASELASLTLFLMAFSVAALTHRKGDIK